MAKVIYDFRYTNKILKASQRRYDAKVYKLRAEVEIDKYVRRDKLYKDSLIITQNGENSVTYLFQLGCFCDPR